MLNKSRVRVRILNKKSDTDLNIHMYNPSESEPFLIYVVYYQCLNFMDFTIARN